MQPLQCDLEPQIPKHPRTTHTRRTKHCTTPSRNQSHTKTNGPHPPRTWGTFHRRPKPLHTEKHKVSCSGFLPKKNMRHACSHWNAFCSTTRAFMQPWLSHHTTSQSHHFPRSTLPSVATSQSHRIPFVTTSLRLHFPRSSLPQVPTPPCVDVLFCDVRYHNSICP